eukprot:CAMPEP_0185736476 /NCGR_PEP_ID=MMETSP1171-20130828/27970_1 /TAXON_ID=374046 /ORGANISM="Helicotheca tamensis, Strain CCMP826" /LENGTH=63 /DNA_ID=CAMNT_0028407107 /DNA_START=106 /DNA_END=294 /DNA_ORIENTATION=-
MITSYFSPKKKKTANSSSDGAASPSPSAPSGGRKRGTPSKDVNQDDSDGKERSKRQKTSSPSA